jgi:hypothetical protein
MKPADNHEWQSLPDGTTEYDPDDFFESDEGSPYQPAMFQQHPAILTYLSVVGIVGFLVMTELRFGLIRPFGIFLVGILMLVFLRVWSIPLILFAVQLELVVSEPFSADASVSPLANVVFVTGVVLLLLAGSRFVVLTSSPLPYDTSTFKFFGRIFRGNKEPNTGHSKRDAALYSSTELSTALIRVTLSVAIAAWWLWYVPLDSGAVDYAWILPTGLRSITLALLALGVIVAANVLISAYVWQGISGDQARLYLHSVATRWSFREVRSIIRRQIKARLKRKGRK